MTGKKTPGEIIFKKFESIKETFFNYYAVYKDGS